MFFGHHLKREIMNIPNYFFPKNDSTISIVSPRLGDNAFYVFDYLAKQSSYDVEFMFIQGHIRNSELISTIFKKFHEIYGIKPKFLRSKEGLSHYYRSKWVFSDGYVAITKPTKTQNIVQLWHGYIGKRIGFMNPNKPDETALFNRTTSLFTTQSSFLVLQFMAEFRIPYEKFVITTSPRFDRILISKSRARKLLKSLEIDTSFKHILLGAPTFRRDEKNNIDPIKSVELLKTYISDRVQKVLRENDSLLVIKPHPSLTPYLEKLEVGSDNIVFLSNKTLYENLIGITDILPAFDMLITDYSSVFVDYLLLDRPVVFFVPDYAEVQKSLGYTVDFETYTPGPKVYTPSELAETIQYYLNSDVNDEFKMKRQCIRDVLIEKWYPKDNTKRLLQDIGLI